MDTGIKNKRQNWGSHLKNIHGSPFRRKWISEWLNENKGKNYKDAVQAYIKYKTEIAKRWASPVALLLRNLQPCERFCQYLDLINVSKGNVDSVRKALTATENELVEYWKLTRNSFGTEVTSGWIKEEDKYIYDCFRA